MPGPAIGLWIFEPRGFAYVLIPIIGSDEMFSWAAWVSLSRDNFARSADLRDTTGRETEEPYFGWLSTDLFLYSPSTINVKTRFHTRPK
ncbi:hypothetical protein (DUF2199) [Streptomyces sp. Ncost-T6T-1]|uniref:DUF2199 domain-containing protein n=1 Tax=Streptomyces sp. Ncost-T6T-1 TaxID=1100828 RepID=UPI0008057891|nr:hypothetical protein (DUF2199) [Streptomyces sp. Ncost-T6T-1]